MLLPGRPIKIEGRNNNNNSKSNDRNSNEDGNYVHHVAYWRKEIEYSREKERPVVDTVWIRMRVFA